MIAHFILSMALICFLSNKWRRRYSSNIRGLIEISSEFLLLSATVLLSVFVDRRHVSRVQENVETLFLLVFGTLIIVSMTDAIRIAVNSCILSSRVRKTKRVIIGVKRRIKEDMAKKKVEKRKMKEIAHKLSKIQNVKRKLSISHDKTRNNINDLTALPPIAEVPEEDLKSSSAAERTLTPGAVLAPPAALSFAR